MYLVIDLKKKEAITHLWPRGLLQRAAAAARSNHRSSGGREDRAALHAAADRQKVRQIRARER